MKKEKHNFKPNYENALIHAKAVLKIDPEKKTEDYIGLFKNYLKVEEHRIFLAHRSGQSGLQTVKERSNLIDILFNQLLELIQYEKKRYHK